MLIENAKTYHKSIWILLQDLSKAYNQVDLSILKSAIVHLKIFQFCIDFIIDFFTYCKNTILITSSLTEYYDIKIEINQNEVILLLL